LVNFGASEFMVVGSFCRHQTRMRPLPRTGAPIGGLPKTIESPGVASLIWLGRAANPCAPATAGSAVNLPFHGASGSVDSQTTSCDIAHARTFLGPELETSAAIEIAKHTLLACGLILAIGAFAGLLAQRIRIPDVAVFLVVGIALGPQALGLIDIRADSALNQIILLFGASYILFDGGASLRFNVLKQVWITIVVIATAGVLITTGITALAAHAILGVPMILALLLGTTLASTDPATLVPIFRQVRIRDRVAQTVMSESAFNDAMAAIVTFGVLAVATGGGEFSLARSVFDFFRQSVIGIVAGITLGYLAALLIAHRKWAFLAEYAPVVTLVAVIGAYFAADGLQASGFMAVFVSGIVLGNKESFGFKMEVGEAQKLDDYVSTTSFILRLFIFILLGAQVDFTLIGQYWLGGVAVVAVLMLVARPVTVFLCALPDRRARWSFREMLFMCWTRETGVIPAALAGLLSGMKAPGAPMIASVTFIAILMTILIQASTTRWLGRKLGLLEADEV
jgi:potassium/hydrogen antiporter